MNPGVAMIISSLISAGAGMMSGKKGEQKSGYTKTQRKGLEGIMQDIQNIKGGATDVTQNPQYQQGNEWLMSMFNDPEFFKSFEAPMQRQFQEQTVPDLANRFASMGSGGSTGSTAFRNQLGREGSNLQTNLAALRGGMQQNAIPQLFGAAQQPFSNMMQMYQTAMGQPINNQYQPPSAGGWGSMAAPFANGAMQYFANQPTVVPGAGGGGGGINGGQPSVQQIY